MEALSGDTASSILSLSMLSVWLWLDRCRRSRNAMKITTIASQSLACPHILQQIVVCQYGPAVRTLSWFHGSMKGIMMLTLTLCNIELIV